MPDSSSDDQVMSALPSDAQSKLASPSDEQGTLASPSDEQGRPTGDEDTPAPPRDQGTSTSLVGDEDTSKSLTDDEGDSTSSEYSYESSSDDEPEAPVEILYTRDVAELPGPLPTIEAIQAAIPGYNRGFPGVVILMGAAFPLGEHYFVKLAGRAHEIEGHALLFVEQHLPAVPAPRLYQMFRQYSVNLQRSGKRPVTYLIMSRLPGASLDSVWGGLSEAQRTAVAEQLRDAVSLMRALPSPGYYGGVKGGELRHELFQDGASLKRPDMSGPFVDERGFSRALALHSTIYIARMYDIKYYRHPRWLGELMGRNLEDALHGHPSTFTHSDLQQKNILVAQDEEGSVKISIVDWEMAGWYPSYWEYAISFCFFYKEPVDWVPKFEIAVKPCLLEGTILLLKYKYDMPS